MTIQNFYSTVWKDEARLFYQGLEFSIDCDMESQVNYKKKV